MPTIHGYELSPGDDLGRGTAPDCCEREMALKGVDGKGYRDYMCACGTTLTVAPSGVIFDIRG